ncbi:MAG TPA: BPSS1780 family membrane protein, partial [Burkholderiaceae bacterium]|nr:BPSS1780 family membrane protein [Burkholderiaceae bacterium]
MSHPEPHPRPAPRPAPAIRLREVPAAAGLAWVRRGLRAFMRRPVVYVLLLIALLVALVSMLLLPPFLRLLAFGLTPLASLSFMIATEAVDNDLPVTPGMFARPLATSGAQSAALLCIGLVYVVTGALVYLAADRIDGGESNRWLIAMSTPKADGSPPDPLPLSGVATLVTALQVGWFALVSVPLWHAPALVHWGRQGALHAMFSNVVALWRTRAAFVMYQLGLVALSIALGLLATLLAAALGDARFVVVLMTLVMAFFTIA